MTRHLRPLLALWIALAFAATGLPQTQPLKLRVVLSRDEGGRKISYPYTLPLVLGITSQLRFGSEVPTVTPQNRTTLQQVGVEINAFVRPAADGRFLIQFTVKANPRLPGGRIGQFDLNQSVTVGDGETSEFRATDGGETLNVAVTLVAVK